MVNPNDPFGAMMVKNFKLRNIPLKGMDFFNSFADIKNHYNQIACEVEIYNMKDIYYVHLNQEERKRIEKLEFLDELEEFFLMLQHYFMSLAKKSKITTAASPSLENTIISRLRLGV